MYKVTMTYDTENISSSMTAKITSIKELIEGISNFLRDITPIDSGDAIILRIENDA